MNETEKIEDKKTEQISGGGAEKPGTRRCPKCGMQISSKGTHVCSVRKQ